MTNKGYLEKKPRRTSKRGRVGKVTRQSIYQKYIDRYRQAECVLNKIRVYVKESEFRNEDTVYEDENEPKYDIENKSTIRTQIPTDYQYCSCQSIPCHLPQNDSYYSKFLDLSEHLDYSHPKIEKTDTFECQPFTLPNDSDQYFEYKPHMQVTKENVETEVQTYKNKELRIILQRVQLHNFSHTYSHLST